MSSWKSQQAHETIINKLAGQAGVTNAGYVQLAHLVMDSQKIGFIETQTRGSKQKVWNLNHYTMKLD